MNELAEKLLEAHVAHELSQLRGAALEQLIEARAKDVLAWLAEVPVRQLVPREYVLDVIQRYVIELRVSGGITELAGEMARVVFRSSANARASLSDILPARSFSDFTEEVIAFEALRRDLITMAAGSATLVEVVGNVITRLVSEALERGTAKLSPTQAIAERLKQRALPDVVERIGHLVQRELDKHRESIAQRLETQLTQALDADALRSFAEELWQRTSKRPLAESFALVGEQGVEDFVIFCYEFWLEFRRTPYFRSVLHEAVGAFFDKYGDETVATLLEDMGVSDPMILSELQLMIPQLLEHARETGLLEQQLRAHLRAFYSSDDCLKLLG